MKKSRKFNKGLSLVELMVAVSVLSVGTGAILQARLGVVTALDTATSKMNAWQLLENKMNVLEQLVREEGGIIIQEQQEDVMLGARHGKWLLEISSMDITMSPEEWDDPEWEKEGNSQRLLKVMMRLSWNERNQDKNVVLVAYLPEKMDE